MVNNRDVYVTTKSWYCAEICSISIYSKTIIKKFANAVSFLLWTRFDAANTKLSSANMTRINWAGGVDECKYTYIMHTKWILEF